ncbi:hypothetical protein N7454_005429 [Penicillium verhagenii]|nr:hypothetical protein N7454_005429 [Penicillium verhagenii]
MSKEHRRITSLAETTLILPAETKIPREIILDTVATIVVNVLEPTAPVLSISEPIARKRILSIDFGQLVVAAEIDNPEIHRLEKPITVQGIGSRRYSASEKEKLASSHHHLLPSFNQTSFLSTRTFVVRIMSDQTPKHDGNGCPEKSLKKVRFLSQDNSNGFPGDTNTVSKKALSYPLSPLGPTANLLAHRLQESDKLETVPKRRISAKEYRRRSWIAATIARTELVSAIDEMRAEYEAPQKLTREKLLELQDQIMGKRGQDQMSPLARMNILGAFEDVMEVHEEAEKKGKEVIDRMTNFHHGAGRSVAVRMLQAFRL